MDTDTYKRIRSARIALTVAVIALVVQLVCVAVRLAYAATISVCASGCDYTTIQGAVNAAIASDTVEIRDSGTYTEQVSRTISGLTIRALGGTTPTIDAQNTRASCILAYTSWNLIGLRCTNTTSHGFAGNGGSREYHVYDCRLSSIGGHGITTMNGTPTIARTVIHTVTSSGISITASADISNVVVYGYGAAAISATGTNASITHCTVYGGTAGTYCIAATGTSGVARYNALDSCYATVAGIRVGASGATMYNNVYNMQGGGPAYYAGASTGDTTSASMLVSPPTDLHPAAGSPLIDATVGSSQTLDVDGVTRVGAPDKGAYEYIAAVARPMGGGVVGLIMDGGVIGNCYSDGF